MAIKANAIPESAGDDLRRVFAAFTPDRPDAGCWEWQGTRVGSRRNLSGYGQVRYGGTYFVAHRVSWVLHRGPIPAGMLVCHRCDNPPCVRPDHLFLGTAADNAHDREAKGRRRGGARGGSLNFRAKVTEEQVREARRRRAQGATCVAIAADLGLSKGAVVQMTNGRTWRNVA